MSQAIVVGGGLGGLVLARRLAMGGVSVTLLEASDHLGGSIARQSVGGIDLDAGAESFSRRGGAVAALATEVGLGDAIVSPNTAGAWLQPVTGEARPMPALSLMGIPGSPMAADVIAIIGKRAALRAQLEALLPGTYAANSKTVGELVRRRMGATVLDALVAPIVRGVYSSEPDTLDLDRVAPGLRPALRRTGSLARAVRDLRGAASGTAAKAESAVAGIRGGMNRLVEELGADLDRLGVDVRLGTRVTAIGEDSVTVGDGATETLTGRVVVATAGLLGQPAEAGHRTVLATLVVDAPELDAAPRGTGMLIAQGASGISARALTHATAKWPWLAESAAGKHVVRLSYSAVLENHAEVARADAQKLLGVRLPQGSVIDFALVEWHRPARQAHTPEGISLVGETASGTGMAAVVAHAEAQALLLLHDFAR